MDETPSKRRRTSPTTHVGVSATGSPSQEQPQQPSTTTSRPGRPSFASPTRASLSRFNPQILERRRSQSPLKPADTTASPQVSRAAAAAGAARRNDALPRPRPLPQRGPDDDDEDINPFIGRSLRRSPTTGTPIAQRPEPELPPTVHDPVSSTPPRGIHSSPSLWRERSKAKKKSPLKNRVQGLEAYGFTERANGETRPPPAAAAAARRGRQSDDEDELQTVLTTAAERNVPAYDSLAAKKKQRDDLRKELTRLKADLRIANQENERIRLIQSSGQHVSSRDEDRLLDLLRRYLNAEPDEPKPSQSQTLAAMALRPFSLLPFGKPALTKADTRDTKIWDNIKSHHPVPMTIDEELPYLQLFSPFSVSSTVAVMSSGSDKTVKQRHSIHLRSKELIGSFNAKIELLVNSNELAITNMHMVALDSRAKPELDSFVEMICSGDCNRSMQRNVAVLVWGIGEWHRLSLQRARLWLLLDAELGKKETLRRTLDRHRRRLEDRTIADTNEDDTNSQNHPMNRPDILQYMGCRSYKIELGSTGARSSGGISIRLDWTISLDWTGEAHNHIDIMTGLPGKWRSLDRRGALGKLPVLFRDLVEAKRSPASAVKTVATLILGAAS